MGKSFVIIGEDDIKISGLVKDLTCNYSDEILSIYIISSNEDKLRKKLIDYFGKSNLSIFIDDFPRFQNYLPDGKLPEFKADKIFVFGEDTKRELHEAYSIGGKIPENRIWETFKLAYELKVKSIEFLINDNI